MKVLTPVLLALWIAHGLAGVLAVLLARRRTEHRPIAAFLVGTLDAELDSGAGGAFPLRGKIFRLFFREK